MKITTIGECTAGHTDREHQAVSATAITGTGSIQRRSDCREKSHQGLAEVAPTALKTFYGLGPRTRETCDVRS